MFFAAINFAIITFAVNTLVFLFFSFFFLHETRIKHKDLLNHVLKMNLDTGASALPLFSLNWLNVDAVSLMLSTQKKKKVINAIKTKTWRHPNLISYHLINLIEALVYH